MTARITGGYADWVDWLDRFSRGIDAPPPDRMLGQGDGLHTMHRFVDGCTRAMQARYALWSKQFSRDLAAVFARPTEYGELEVRKALVDARKRLRPLVALVTCPSITPEIREPLFTSFANAVRDLQVELESDARRIGPAGHGRLKALRELRLDAVLTETPPAVPAAPAPQTPTPTPPGGGRRVVVFPEDRA